MPTEKNIKTPEQLYKYFEQYKEYCKKNPKKENFWSSRSNKEVSVSREIPLTWIGFENYMRKKKIIETLQDYEFNRDDRYSEYVTIIRAIKNEIYEDKYAGATAGIFQHNIIARDLGLSEKREVEQKLTIDSDGARDKLAEAIGKITDTGADKNPVGES